jgi:hypothetical protein
MSTPLKADIMQLPGSGQVNNAWNGIPGSGDVVLFANNDINNTWYIGFSNSIAIGGPNTVPIPPSGTVQLSAARTVYAIAAKGTTPLVIIPGGGAYFQGLTQGQGQLVLPSVRSPNFITQVSGWTINKDGSAEFNNLTIRGTFFGTNFVLNQNGLFMYDPTETLGNLVVSITAKAVTGPLGESVPPGITIGKVSDVQLELFRDPTFATGIIEFLLNNAAFKNPLIDSAIITGPPPFAAMLLTSGASNTVGFRDAVHHQFNSSDGVSSFANMALSYVSDLGATSLFAFMDGSGFGIKACSQLTATDPTTGTGPGNIAQSESWHDLRPLQNSFVGTIAGRYPPQYRKTADGTIEVEGFIQLPATYNGVTFATVPPAYRPGSNSGWKGPCFCETNPTSNLGSPNVQVDTSGNLQLHNLGTGLSGTIVSIQLRYPLNNTGTINA